MLIKLIIALPLLSILGIGALMASEQGRQYLYLFLTGGM